jgi:hypothetical protein
VPATPGLVAVMGRVCPGIGVAAGTAAGSGSGKAFMGTDDDELADELREGGDAEDQTAAIKFLQGLSRLAVHDLGEAGRRCPRPAASACTRRTVALSATAGV